MSSKKKTDDRDKKNLSILKKKDRFNTRTILEGGGVFYPNSSNALKNNATMTTMAMRAPFFSVPSLSYSSLSSKGKHGTSTSRGDDKKCVKIVLSSSASTATTESSHRHNVADETQGKDTKARKLAVPYNDGNKDCDILINEHAKQKIAERNCSKFVSLIDAENPKLKTLLNIIERDWTE